MSAEDTEIEVNGTDEVQDKKQKKATKHDGGAADLEQITDYVEEKEISAEHFTSVSGGGRMRCLLNY